MKKAGQATKNAPNWFRLANLKGEKNMIRERTIILNFRLVRLPSERRFKK